MINFLMWLNLVLIVIALFIGALYRWREMIRGKDETEKGKKQQG